jgi:hypothetical protein
VLDPGSVPLGALGVVLLAAALVRPAAALVPWALASLAAAYALALVLADGDLDARAGFVAAGLLLVGELALAAATIGTLLVAAGAAVPPDTRGVQLVGVAGAVGALLTLALLARR